MKKGHFNDYASYSAYITYSTDEAASMAILVSYQLFRVLMIFCMVELKSMLHTEPTNIVLLLLNSGDAVNKIAHSHIKFKKIRKSKKMTIKNFSKNNN